MSRQEFRRQEKYRQSGNERRKRMPPFAHRDFTVCNFNLDRESDRKKCAGKPNGIACWIGSAKLPRGDNWDIGHRTDFNYFRKTNRLRCVTIKHPLLN